MDFYEAKKCIDEMNRFGSTLGLDNICELLRRLDNPQDKVKIIHVAGTNGKGSTIAYLSSILKEAGYRVGKYTSPVVFEYLEKYQIDDINISEDDFSKLADKAMAAVEAMVTEKKGQPTIFEVETAMAYLYFYESGCDVAIIETGMGGDMDATNVCAKVLASVIVSVSLDHTAVLGGTLQEIAGHKAGIIKAGCPVILYGQSEQVMGVVRARANSLSAPLVISKTDKEYSLPLTYETTNGVLYEGIDPALQGVHQIKNVCTVLEAVEQIKLQGFDIPREAVVKGVANTTWQGRFEKICENPLFIIDGAHNPGAVSELKSTLQRYYKDKKWVFIMGVLADKDFSTEIRMMSGIAETIITVTPPNPRALNANELAGTIRNIDKAARVIAVESMEEAVKVAMEAYNHLQGDKGILAYGSLSYLGVLKKYVKIYVEQI